MEANSWSCLFAASKRHQSTLRSPFDMYLGLEEIDGAEEDDSPAQFACPFCFEDFDIVGLCCHLDDDHPVEMDNGEVCPICAARTGIDIVGHITVQHGNFFKMTHRRRLFKGSPGSHSTHLFLRKDLQDANVQSLFGDSLYTLASSNAAADPLLLSFIFNLPAADCSKDAQPVSSDEGSTVDDILDEKMVDRVEPSLSGKDQERAQRSEFVRELMLSTIFDDNLCTSLDEG